MFQEALEKWLLSSMTPSSNEEFYLTKQRLSKDMSSPMVTSEEGGREGGENWIELVVGCIIMKYFP